MKAEMKAVVASIVVIALALTAVSGITYSWFSDEEKATIDVTTGVIDIKSTGATIAINDGAPVSFDFVKDEPTAVALSTPLKPGDVISVKYTTENNSTIDAFLIIDCNLNVFTGKQTISTEVKSEGSAVAPVSGHYVLSKDTTYSVEITIEISTDADNTFANKTGTLTITNKAIQSDAPLAVSTAEDLTDALANEAIKSIEFTGNITSAITTDRDVELIVDGTITTDGTTITVSSGTLTLSGDGVIKNTKRATGIAAVVVSPGAGFIMNGGNLESDFIGLRIGDANSNFDAEPATAQLNSGIIVSTEGAILIGNNSTVSITGGEFTSNDNAVLMGNGSKIKNVTVNVTGGTFIGNIQTAGCAACGIFVSSPGNWNIDGATFKIKNGTAICVRTGNVVIGTHNTYEITVDDGFTGSKIGDSTYIIKAGSTSVITGYYDSGYNHTDTDSLKVGDKDISLGGTISYYDKDGNSVSMS